MHNKCVGGDLRHSAGHRHGRVEGQQQLGRRQPVGDLPREQRPALVDERNGRRSDRPALRGETADLRGEKRPRRNRSAAVAGRGPGGRADQTGQCGEVVGLADFHEPLGAKRPGDPL